MKSENFTVLEKQNSCTLTVKCWMQIIIDSNSSIVSCRNTHKKTIILVKTNMQVISVVNKDYITVVIFNCI